MAHDNTDPTKSWTRICKLPINCRHSFAIPDPLHNIFIPASHSPHPHVTYLQQTVNDDGLFFPIAQIVFILYDEAN